MMNGTAALSDPNTGAAVGTFTECCAADGTATAKIVLLDPIQISDKDFLAVYAQGKAVPAIVIYANGLAQNVTEFGGASAIGCIPDGTNVSLVRSPGGDLGTLLIVIGRGTIRAS
jgi:hypothetical protein